MAVETARERRAKQLLEEFLHWGIQEPDALYFYIQEYLGYRMPTKALCAHHQSPFEFIEAAFFEKFRSAVLMGARLSGKTLLLAILNHLDSMLKGKIEIIHTGASLAQANRGNRYFKETFEAPFMSQYLVSSSASPKSSYNSTSTTWNGSIVGITAGTMKGLNSSHGQRVKVDEVEVLNSWEILQEAMSISHSTDTIQAQDIFASTRKRPSGIMQRLLNEADERDMRVFGFCVFEVVERCERDCVDDKMYGTCPILNLCKGRAHHSDGWFKIGDLIAKAKNMSPNTFAAQWECKKPSDSQLVYGNYWYEDIHVLSLSSDSRFKSLHSVFGVWTIPHEWKRVGAIDFGARFCYLQFAIDPRTEIWIAEYEYFYEGDRLLSLHVENIKKAPGWPRRMPIYADPSGKQERLELAKIHSIKTLPAVKNIPLGVDEVRKQLSISPILGKPKLYVMENCTRLRMEMETWAHPVNKDGTPDFDDYNSGPDDSADCCFIKGSMIQTPSGERPIEGIRVGDMVLTRQGYKPVALTWQSIKRVCRVDLSHASSLTGTLTHPVYAEGKGWTGLDSLRYGDILVPYNSYEEKAQWQELSLWSTEALSSVAIQTLSNLVIETILRQALQRGNLGLMLSTDKSGRMLTEKYLQASIFTTKMRVAGITDSQILSASLLVSTYLTTLQTLLKSRSKLALSMWIALDHLQRLGTVQKKVGNGIRNIPRTSGITESLQAITATIVEQSISLGLLAACGFVPTDVNLPVEDMKGGIMKPVSAPGARQSSSSTDIRNKTIAPVHVVCKPVGTEDAMVYNLTVAECPEYFVNGVLVHNCRYALFSYERTHTSKMAAMTIDGL